MKEIEKIKSSAINVSLSNTVKLDNLFAGDMVWYKKGAFQYMEMNCDNLQKKIIRIVFSEIKRSDTEFKPVTIAFLELLKMIGLAPNGKNYNKMSKAISQLSEVSAVIHTVPTKNEITHTALDDVAETISVFDSVEVNGRYITFLVSSSLKPYLIDLRDKKSFSYKLENVLGLRKKYSISLYELFKSHQKQGTFVIKVESLFSVLFGDEIPKDVYVDGDKKAFSVTNIRTYTYGDAKPSFEKAGNATSSYVYAYVDAEPIVDAYFTERTRRTIPEEVRFLNTWRRLADLFDFAQLKVEKRDEATIEFVLNEDSKNSLALFLEQGIKIGVACIEYDKVCAQRYNYDYLLDEDYYDVEVVEAEESAPAEQGEEVVW